MNKTDKLMLTIAIFMIAITESVHLFFSFWDVEPWLPVQAFAWLLLCLIFIPLDISLLGTLYFIRNILKHTLYNKMTIVINIVIFSISIINIMCCLMSYLNVFQNLIVLPTYSSVIIVICFTIDVIIRKKQIAKK